MVTNRSRPEHCRRDNYHSTEAGAKKWLSRTVVGSDVITPPHPRSTSSADRSDRPAGCSCPSSSSPNMLPTTQSDSSAGSPVSARRVTGSVRAARGQYPDIHHPYPMREQPNHSVLTISGLSRYLTGADHHSRPGTVPPRREPRHRQRQSARPGLPGSRSRRGATHRAAARPVCHVQPFTGNSSARPRWARTKALTPGTTTRSRLSG